jgi:hypothetical protein
MTHMVFRRGKKKEKKVNNNDVFTKMNLGGSRRITVRRLGKVETLIAQAGIHCGIVACLKADGPRGRKK